MRDISEVLSDGSGVVVHEVVADGSVWTARTPATPNGDGRRGLRLQHGRDRQVPGRRGADLALDGRRRLPRRDARLHAAQPGVRAHAARRRRRRLARGQRQRRAAGHGRGEARQRRLLHPRAVRLRRHGRAAGNAAEATRPRPRRRRARARFEARGGSRPSAQYADSLGPGERADQPEALDRRRPDGGRASVDGEFVPGLAVVRARHRARWPRARTAATAASGPATAACSTRAAAADPNGGASSASSRWTPGSRPSARATTAASAPTQQQPLHATPTRRRSSPSRRPAARRTSSPARCRRSCRRGRRRGRRRGHAAEHRPLLDLPLDVMQAWGHYGTAWAVVHQQLGVRPSLGRELARGRAAGPGRRSRASRAADIRLGGGSADVFAAHAASAYTTRTDTPTRRVGRSGSGTRCRAAATVASVTLDGATRCDPRAGDEPRPRGAGARPTRASCTRSWSPPGAGRSGWRGAREARPLPPLRQLRAPGLTHLALTVAQLGVAAAVDEVDDEAERQPDAEAQPGVDRRACVIR